MCVRVCVYTHIYTHKCLSTILTVVGELFRSDARERAVYVIIIMKKRGKGIKCNVRQINEKIVVFSKLYYMAVVINIIIINESLSIITRYKPYRRSYNAVIFMAKTL